MRLRVNAPQVIHETIDHEVVIINLASGNYYSLAGTAEEIWTLLEAGISTDDLAPALLERYDGQKDEVASSIERFLGELQADLLVVPDETQSEPAPTEKAAKSTTKTVFEPPRLDRFTEMQHLIALDPIHEVDPARGWPHA